MPLAHAIHFTGSGVAGRKEPASLHLRSPHCRTIRQCLLQRRLHLARCLLRQSALLSAEISLLPPQSTLHAPELALLPADDRLGVACAALHVSNLRLKSTDLVLELSQLSLAACRAETADR